jgi:hypothetical protein
MGWQFFDDLDETLKRALIGPSATPMVLRYCLSEIGATASQPGMQGATVCGFRTKAQTASIGASIRKRSSIFISNPSAVKQPRHGRMNFGQCRR